MFAHLCTAHEVAILRKHRLVKTRDASESAAFCENMKDVWDRLTLAVAKVSADSRPTMDNIVSCVSALIEWSNSSFVKGRRFRNLYGEYTSGFVDLTLMFRSVRTDVEISVAGALNSHSGGSDSPSGGSVKRKSVTPTTPLTQKRLRGVWYGLLESP